MAQQCCAPIGERRYEPPTSRREGAVADRVNSHVETVQTTIPYPPLDGAAVYAEADKLPLRDHSVLTIGDPCDRSLT